MGNLTHYMGGGGGGGGSGSATPLSGVAHDSPADTPDHPSAGSAAADGYASEDFVAGSSSSRERKKGFEFNTSILFTLSNHLSSVLLCLWIARCL